MIHQAVCTQNVDVFYSFVHIFLFDYELTNDYELTPLHCAVEHHLENEAYLLDSCYAETPSFNTFSNIYIYLFFFFLFDNLF